MVSHERRAVSCERLIRSWKTYTNGLIASSSKLVAVLGFIELLSIGVDQGVSHTLQVVIALLQEEG